MKEEHIEDRSSEHQSREEERSSAKMGSTNSQSDASFKNTEDEDTSHLEDSNEDELSKRASSIDKDEDSVNKEIEQEDEAEDEEDVEYTESTEEKSAKEESSEKEDFPYLNEESETDNRSIETEESPKYEEDKREEENPETNNKAERRKEKSYHSREDLSLSEGEDIIECRETMFPIRKEKKEQRKSTLENPLRKIVKLNEEEINKLHQIQWEEFSHGLKQQEKRIELREKGWKINNKPLMWRYEIDHYEDIARPICEEEVINRFRKYIEKPQSESSQQLMPSPCSYSKNSGGKRRKNIREVDLKKVKEAIETGRLRGIQEKLRKEAKEEQRMLNNARNLHVKLKEIGHQSEETEIFSLLSQRYIFQKKDIIFLIEDALEDLASIHNRMQENNQYFYKCIEFIEQKIKID